MSVLGIVAEYNPFHNGHLYHLEKAASAVSPSAVLVALSGPFTQRGEPAFLSPWVRAECALLAGADAVFALPVLWTVRDAEHYALGAVSLLSALGATHLAFGAESEDLSMLQRTAFFLESPPVGFRNELRRLLSEGTGFPAAISMASARFCPESESVLKHPNNILAVCYLRAICRLGLSMIPVLIPRSGCYHSDRIDPSAPSASAIRSALMRGSWQDALSALPPWSRDAVRHAFLARAVPDTDRMDAVLTERIRSMLPEQAALLPDCGEGLDSALLKAAAGSHSREDLISRLTTRRYPSARISRICACAMLNITREQLTKTPLPRSALLLALKRNLSLTGSWKALSLPASPADWFRMADRSEEAAYRFWGDLSGLPGSFPFTQKTLTR